MTRSERVREFVMALRDTHCIASSASAALGEVDNVAKHTTTAEALLAVAVLLTTTFELKELDF